MRNDFFLNQICYVYGVGFFFGEKCSEYKGKGIVELNEKGNEGRKGRFNRIL